VYSSTRVARVLLRHVHRSELESEGDPSTHASLRHNQSGGGGGNGRVRRVVIQFVPPAANASTSSGPGHRTAFYAEPFTKRAKGNAVPALAAHTWHMAHTSAAYGAAGGYVASQEDGNMVGSLERNLFPGNVVTLNGTAYQYRCDDADLHGAIKAFECALFDLRRRKLAKISGGLYGMPVDGVAFKDAVADPVAEGVTVAAASAVRGGGDAATTMSSSPGLRRRGRSSSPLVNGDPSDAEYMDLGPTAAGTQADLLRRAHATADGELAVPFMSTIVVQTGSGTSAAHQQRASEKKRKQRLSQFSRGPSVGL
jgi:hypothetical protein